MPGRPGQAAYGRAAEDTAAGPSLEGWGLWTEGGPQCPLLRREAVPTQGVCGIVPSTPGEALAPPRAVSTHPGGGVPGPVLLKVPNPTMAPDVLSFTLPESLAHSSLKPPQSMVSGAPHLGPAASVRAPGPRPTAAQLEHLSTESGQHQSLLHDPHVCPKAWLRGPTGAATPDEWMKASTHTQWLSPLIWCPGITPS